MYLGGVGAKNAPIVDWRGDISSTIESWRAKVDEGAVTRSKACNKTRMIEEKYHVDKF